MKILNKIKEYKRRYHEKRKTTLALSGLSITTDWVLLLGLSFLILVILISSAVNLYLNTNNIFNNRSDMQNGVVKLNTEDIKQVLETLDKAKTLKMKVADSKGGSDFVENSEDKTIDEQ